MEQLAFVLTLTNIATLLPKEFAWSLVCIIKICNNNLIGNVFLPDIEKIISKSRDYEELKYVWSQWRDVSGAKMRTNYQNYVNLSNQDAKANG